MGIGIETYDTSRAILPHYSYLHLAFCYAVYVSAGPVRLDSHSRSVWRPLVVAVFDQLIRAISVRAAAWRAGDSTACAPAHAVGRRCRGAAAVDLSVRPAIRAAPG